MKKNMNDDMCKNDSWVCCPACGKKNLKSQMGIHPVRCEACKNEYNALVIKGGILILPREEVNLYSTYLRFNEYMKDLICLAGVQN